MNSEVNPMIDWGFFLAGCVVPVVLGYRLSSLYRGAKEGTARGVALVLKVNVLILAFLWSLIFVGSESYYRFWVDTTDSFSMSRVSKEWFKRHYHRNQARYRDDIPYDFDKRDDRRRITFVGDSFTVGQGVENVGDRFANRIRAMHPEWEIHAIAKNGLNTGDHIARLSKMYSKGYQTDEVVLVYVLNDIEDLSREWQQVYSRIVSDFPTSPLFRYSYFLNHLALRSVASRNPGVLDYFDFVHSAYDGDAWRTETRRLQALRRLVVNHEDTFKVVIFPFLHNLGDYALRSAHHRLNAFWTQEGVEHLDLLTIFSERPNDDWVVNPYDAHPNEKAHALAAQAIAEFLAK